LVVTVFAFIAALAAGLAVVEAIFALPGTIEFRFLLVFHGLNLLSTIGWNPPPALFQATVVVIAHDPLLWIRLATALSPPATTCTPSGVESRGRR